MAADGQILLDANAAATVMPVIALEPLGPQVLKGFERPMPVFAVARATAESDAALPALGQHGQA
jgi:class 3 adenylate cyclase